ncbi:MAG: hypothetical protein V4638_05895 [Bacteroidota bacterium]
MNKNYTDEIPMNAFSNTKKQSPQIKTIEAILNYSRALEVGKFNKGKVLIHLN